MDGRRVAYRLLQAYVLGLFALGVGTTLWLVAPRFVSSPQVAGFWFALGGFGALVVVSLLLVHSSLERGRL